MNRERIAAFAHRMCWEYKHSSTFLFNETTLFDFAEAIVREAVEAEREACAVMIEPKNDKSDWTQYAHDCAMLARMIRARGEKTV